MTEIISIRSAVIEDLPILIEFEQGIVFAERPFDPQLKSGRISYYDLGEMIVNPDAEILVAEHIGTLVGSGSIHIKTSKAYVSHDVYSYLGFMYVDPNYRGQGINKLIIDGLAAWSRSRGIHEMQLDVYDKNEGAIRAYEKYGFKKSLVQMRIELDQ